jgi:PhnB protein
VAEREGLRPGVQAQLSVRQGRAAVEFYKAAFGATELFRFGGDDANEEIVAQLAVGDGAFWVEDESPRHHNFSPQSLGGASERMLVIVDDPRGVVEQAKAAGATEIYPVAEEHGWLLGRVADPFGHHWEIGKPLIEWPPHPAAAGQPEAGEQA